MLRRCLTLCCALLFLNVPTAFAGQWYSGIIHVHTTFSDGSDNVPQRVKLAKKLGYKFIIVTDHYEQINSLDKPTAKYAGNLANPRAIDITFKDYRRNCDEQTDSSFVTIPGAEIQAIWEAESDTQDMSHTLALGPLGDSGSKDLDKLLSASGDQREIIACVNNKMRMLPVAAHPALISEKSFPKVWEWQRCRYDLRTPEAYDGIKGVEFFNSDTVQQNRDVLTWYLSLIKERKSVFVTSGCDSHGWHWPDDSARWKRVTWVSADSLTTQGILGALADGQSYAAANGAYIKEMNHRPGKSVQTVDRPAFKLTVSFQTPITAPKTVVMYRDGAEVADSRRTFEKGTDLKYDWTDTSTPVGEHWYVLWVDGVLVTSPIKLAVTRTAEDGHPVRQGTMLFVRNGDIWRADLRAGKSAIIIRNGRHPVWIPDNTAVLFTRLLSSKWDKTISCRLESWGLFRHDLVRVETARVGRITSEQPILAAQSAKDGSIVYQYANFKGQPVLCKFPGRESDFDSLLCKAQYHWGLSVSDDGAWLAYQGGGVDSR